MNIRTTATSKLRYKIIPLRIKGFELTSNWINKELKEQVEYVNKATPSIQQCLESRFFSLPFSRENNQILGRKERNYVNLTRGARRSLGRQQKVKR